MVFSPLFLHSLLLHWNNGIIFSFSAIATSMDQPCQNLMSFQTNLIGSSGFFDSYFEEYNKVIATIVVATLLCSILVLVSYIFSLSNPKEHEKTSEYECGFEPFDSATRQPFDVHFYIVSILFLVFDVEVALLFPWSASLNLVGSTGFWSMIFFLFVLTVGFAYEWCRGALAWPHISSDFDTIDNTQPK